MISAAATAQLHGVVSAAPGTARELGHVVALVAVLGHRFVARAGAHGGAELGHLRAGVVEVVLAADGVPRELQQPRQRVPVGGMAAPAAVNGPVGLAETYSTLTFSGARRAAAPVVTRGDDLPRGAHVPGVGEEDVQEAGTGDLDAVDRIAEALGQPRAEALGDLPRRRAQRGREQHRGVGRVVAEAGVLGALQARPLGSAPARRCEGPPRPPRRPPSARRWGARSMNGTAPPPGSCARG